MEVVVPVVVGRFVGSPFGKHRITVCYGNSPSFIGESTFHVNSALSIAYVVCLPEGNGFDWGCRRKKDASLTSWLGRAGTDAI